MTKHKKTVWVKRRHRVRRSEYRAFPRQYIQEKETTAGRRFDRRKFGAITPRIFLIFAHTENMNALAVFLAAALTAPVPCTAQIRPKIKPIETVAVTCGNDSGTAKLYGKGENFISNLTVTVKFGGHDPYRIQLEDGYSPLIATFDFGAEDKLLFCSSQTGGSGGYGNYRVYRLKTDGCDLLYDDKENSAQTNFSAVFRPDGFMQITNGQNSLDVYVGYMDKTFYGEIFAPDGSLKGKQPDIADISYVSPALNPASGIYRLTTYQAVSAVAEVNRLGYIVRFLDFDGNAFIPSSADFSVNL